MDSEGRERKRAPQSKSERDSYNGSQQADDNLTLTFRRHLQSRSNLNHNNQSVSRPENIKHGWCLQPSTGSWTVLWCVEDYRGCRYSPALTAKRGWPPSIVVQIGIPHHRRSYKIRSPNVSRYVKWLKILQEIWKVVEHKKLSKITLLVWQCGLVPREHSLWKQCTSDHGRCIHVVDFIQKTKLSYSLLLFL